MALIIGRYARISTAENKKALERINYVLEQAVLKLGGDLAQSPLWCEIISGRRRDRPEFLKMRQEVEARRLDILVTYRVDRLARDAEYGIGFGRLLEQSGVRLYDCQREGFIDFSNPDEWERYASQSVQAEAESRKLSTRIRAGKAFGRHTGQAGSKPPWGYVRNAQTERYEIDPALAVAVLDSVLIVLEKGNFCVACRRIAAKHGKQWEPNSLRIWICNPVLRGHTGYGRNGRSWSEIKYNTHPEHAVITEAQYQQIETLIAERRQYWGGNIAATKHTLGGLVYCDRCGGKMCITSSTRARESPLYYFSCRERAQRVKPEGVCTLKRSLPLAELETVVINALTSAAGQIATLAQTPEQKPKSPRLLELERLLIELERLGNNAALESSKNQLKIEISQLQTVDYVDSDALAQSREMLECVFGSAIEWAALKQPERRAVFRDLLEKVTVDYEEFEIGTTRSGNPRLRIDWTVQVTFSHKLRLRAMTVLLPYVPKSSRRKLIDNP